MTSRQRLAERLAELSELGASPDHDPARAVVRLRASFLELLDQALSAIAEQLVEVRGLLPRLRDARERAVRRQAECADQLARVDDADEGGRAALVARLQRRDGAVDEMDRAVQRMGDLELALRRLAGESEALSRLGRRRSLVGRIAVGAMKVAVLGFGFVLALRIGALVEPALEGRLGPAAARVVLFVAAYLALEPLVVRLRAALLRRAYRDLLAVPADLHGRIARIANEVDAVRASLDAR